MKDEYHKISLRLILQKMKAGNDVKGSKRFQFGSWGVPLYSCIILNATNEMQGNTAATPRLEYKDKMHML